MGSLSDAGRYWDRRLDPIDWTRVEGATDYRRWREAHACFLSADTREGIHLLGPLRGRRLLELGCGLGVGTAHLAAYGAQVTAIDLSPQRAARARDLQPAGTRDATRFCGADVEHLPFADRSFDAIFARDVLMYADPSRVMQECARVLVPGGSAVFVESLAGPAPVRWYRRWTSPRRYREFTRHLKWSEIATLGAPLRRKTVRPYHLASVLAFACLFVLRKPHWHRRWLARLEPLDAWLLRRFPSMAHWAWRGVCLCENSRDAR